MNLEQVNKLYAYNSWAWDRVFDSLAKLPDEVYKEERPFFWGSLHGLAVHGLAAEWIWLSRLFGESPNSMPEPGAYADFSAVLADWLPVRQRWQQFLGDLREKDLERDVAYRNTRGNGFTLGMADLLVHVINHATEHRSQMTPVLFELGAPTEPLDYMRFCLRP